jgi:hypothetical protein
MNFVVQLPTRAGAAGDVSRRLAAFVGPGIAAPDDSCAAALYLALGTTIATTRAYTAASLTECCGHLAVATLPSWERSLGLLSGEGSPTAARQRNVTARWRAIHAGPSLAEITATVATYEATAVVLEIAMESVYGNDPLAAQRLVVLLPDAVEGDTALRSQVAASLAVQMPGHVAWSIARGDGPDLDPFRCDDGDSLVERDVLAT